MDANEIENVAMMDKKEEEDNLTNEVSSNPSTY